MTKVTGGHRWWWWWCGQDRWWGPCVQDGDGGALYIENAALELESCAITRSKAAKVLELAYSNLCMLSDRRQECSLHAAISCVCMQDDCCRFGSLRALLPSVAMTIGQSLDRAH